MFSSSPLWQPVGISTRPRPSGGVSASAFGDGDPYAPGVVDAYPPPLAPPLTVQNVESMARACDRAQLDSGAEVSPAFVYPGPSVPGLMAGDEITHMVQTPSGCITGAEADRRGLQWRSFANRQIAGIPLWVLASTVAVGVVTYAIISQSRKRR